MLFSSVTFLYYFLPAVLLVYFLVPRWMKNAVLLLFSLAFYGWGEPKLLGLMVFTILMFYFCGLMIGRSKTQNGKKAWLTVSIVISIGLLALFKYADFFIDSFNAVTGLSIPLLRLALPVGISFYTFQSLSYTIDVYRGNVPLRKIPFLLAPMWRCSPSSSPAPSSSTRILTISWAAEATAWRSSPPAQPDLWRDLPKSC